MTDRIRLSTVIAGVAPKRLYEAWLDPREHSTFTGGEATIDPVEGGRFTAWDGYIEGENLSLEPGRRIVQSWRASDFPEGAEASRLEVRFEAVRGGTRLVIDHSNVPPSQRDDFERGWRDYYLRPMRSYFAERADGDQEADDDRKARAAKPAKTASTAKPAKPKATKKIGAKQPARTAKPKRTAKR